MAYSVLEKLKEDALKCELCFEVPGDDDTENVFKQLRCNHTFCKNCLVKLVKPEGRICCPNCRDETVLDNSVSVDKLPLAFQVTNIIDWINKKQANEPGEASDRQCPEHKVQNNFFCIDCSEYVCGDCLVLTHDKKHTSLYIKAEAESMRKEIQKMIEEIDSQLLHLEKAEDQINEKTELINADAVNAKASVQKYAGQVIKTLEENKSWLMISILNEHTAKLKALRTERAVITRQKEEYETKMETVRRSLEHSDDYEVFKARAAVGKIHEEVFDKLPRSVLTDKFLTDSLRFEPNLLAVKRLQSDLDRIGKVTVENMTRSSKSSVDVHHMGHRDISPAVLEHMESLVKGAFELKVQKLPLNDDRKTKCRFIVRQLEGEFGGKWSCILGDCDAKLHGLCYAVFNVNDTDVVFIFKNMLNTTDEDKFAVQEDKKPKLKHEVASSSSNGASKLAVKRIRSDTMLEQYPCRPSKMKSRIPVAKHGQNHTNLHQQEPTSANDHQYAKSNTDVASGL